MRKFKLLLLFVALFSAFNSVACDEAYVTFNGETDNGDGTFKRIYTRILIKHKKIKGKK